MMGYKKLALILVVFFCQKSFSQEQSKSEVYQPSKHPLRFAVVMYDANESETLKMLYPKDVFEETFCEGQDPNLTYLIHYVGENVRIDVPLNKVRFYSIKGQLLTNEDALEKLKKPTHVVLFSVPSVYYQQILKDDLIVVAMTGQWPLPKPELPSQSKKVTLTEK